MIRAGEFVMAAPDVRHERWFTIETNDTASQWRYVRRAINQFEFTQRHLNTTGSKRVPVPCQYVRFGLWPAVSELS